MPANPVPQIRLYQDWLEQRLGRSFADYEALHAWSVSDLEGFWRSIWDYHQVPHQGSFDRALAEERMPGAVWFPGAEVNYVAQVLRHAEAAHAAGQPAIIADNEQGDVRTISWPELRRMAGNLAHCLASLGVRPGDRVAACLPNIPETVIAFLACASLGAVWTLAAPDMGAPAIRDRFAQVAPKILIAADGVFYGGRALDRSATIAHLRTELPSVQHLIVLRTPHATGALESGHDLAEMIEIDRGHDLSPAWLPFDHPLWILYSSGTTGLPKALVHSHGGVLLTALANAKHTDCGPSYEANTLGERFHWYSTTGWVMWNAQIAGLLTGTTICLFDGSPGGTRERPDWTTLWRFAARHRVTFFGAGAAFYASCLKAEVALADAGDLSSVRALGSTGSPLAPDVQRWGTEAFAALGTPDIWWCNISGGTDLCGNFTTGHRELPQRPGVMQCRQIGSSVEAWNEAGEPVIGEVGELVCTRPMPAMPIYLWGDDDGSRYRDAYFSHFPGVWRHGDWIRIDPDGSCTISGRSDATINRAGLRMGSSEIYSAVEALPEILDSLVVDVDTAAGSDLLLFVHTASGTVDEGLRTAIAGAIRTALSPRFIPDRVIAAPGVPRTLSGKKQEVPVKRLLLGQPVQKVFDPSAMANPEHLPFYTNYAREWAEAARITAPS